MEEKVDAYCKVLILVAIAAMVVFVIRTGHAYGVPVEDNARAMLAYLLALVH